MACKAAQVIPHDRIHDKANEVKSNSLPETFSAATLPVWNATLFSNREFFLKLKQSICTPRVRFPNPPPAIKHSTVAGFKLASSKVNRNPRH
jgi:hypothetical protein